MCCTMRFYCEFLSYKIIYYRSSLDEEGSFASIIKKKGYTIDFTGIINKGLHGK